MSSGFGASAARVGIAPLLRGILIGGAAMAAAGAEEDHVGLDRPEGWGMAYVAAATAPSPVSALPPSTPAAFAWGLGADADYLRHLNTRDQQIGFDGTAPEAMNRSPVLGALHGDVVDQDWSGELRWIPPVDVRGIRADVVSAVVARQLVTLGRVGLGLRLAGTIGHLTGDITSDERTANSPGGSAGNPLDTDGESHDIDNWRMAQLGLDAQLPIDDHGTRIFAELEGSYLAATFHVRAEEAGITDRTVLATRGAWGGISAGAMGAIAPHVQLAGAAEYVPLRIRRPGDREAVVPFVTLRLSLTVWQDAR